MSGILSIAVNGLNAAASRVSASSSVIVNATSTTQLNTNTGAVTSTQTSAPDLSSALVKIKSDSTLYDANAVVVKVARKLDQDLLNILA